MIVARARKEMKAASDFSKRIAIRLFSLIFPKKIPIVYDKKIYKLRKKIEIFFGKIKENKRMAMRFEKSDTAFISFLSLATIKALYLC
ncbi:MAG: hypothetical protein ACKO43_06840 [Alphaproteobacteria bacterium]